MTGLTPIVGDGTYFFQMDWTDGLGLGAIVFADSSELSRITKTVGNIIRVKSVAGDNNDFAYAVIGGSTRYCVVIDGSSGHLYVNDVFEETIALTGTIGSFVMIGKDALTTSLTAKVEKLKTFDEVLTLIQVGDL